MDRSKLTYSRRILLCVTGLTPQVVTETLYALYKGNRPLPTEIHLITTANGRNRAERDLLSEKDGMFFQFCDEFALTNQIDFSSENIHVIKGRYDEELPDIRTPIENECAADFIMHMVKEFCADENSQLFVSIAGGRKSMGFLVGYALSIFGRPQDELSHVLTSEPFENNRDFFYPSYRTNPIFAPDGTPLNPLEAQIALADIPFIRLRSGLTDSLLKNNNSFSETIRLAQEKVAPPLLLKFDTQKKTVTCGSKQIPLTPVEFVIYYWFASLKLRKLLPCLPGIDVPYDDCLEYARKLVGVHSATYEKMEKSFLSEEDMKKYFQEKRTKINKKLLSHLGKDQAQHYLITSNKKHLNIKYSLEMASNLIECQ